MADFIHSEKEIRDMPLNNFNDFVKMLLNAGFSVGGGSDEGIYSVVPFDWRNEPWDSRIRWHTGDPETDPCEWRSRVLNERDDIAYSKLFFMKSGYIAKEWYPYFLAARRKGRALDDEYRDGAVSQVAKRAYEVISEKGEAPFHEIKQAGGFSKEDNSRFESALVELQMGLFITICGIRRETSQSGEEYGWPATVFCTTEQFWGSGVFDEADGIRPDEAERAIKERILALNPGAEEKKMMGFIRG